jgi:hypothetical protein
MIEGDRDMSIALTAFIIAQIIATFSLLFTPDATVRPRRY